MNLMHFLRSFKLHQFCPRCKRVSDTEGSNPLLSLFINRHASDETCNNTFDWSQYGIKSPYVIFFTGRCGSTLLTRLIKDTHLAGDPNEFFNIGYVKTYSPMPLHAYLAEIVRTTSSNGFFGLEIDWIHLRFLDYILDFAGIFPPEKTTFFYMTRRDIVAQAWSFASAKATGVWQSYRATSDPHISHPTTQILDDRTIWHEIILILEAEMKFEKFFKRYRIKPTRIDYEMLMTSRRDVLGLVLLDIGCEIESIAAKTDQIVDQTLKIQRDNFDAILNFRHKHKDLLSAAENVRGSNYIAVQRSLRKRGIL